MTIFNSPEMVANTVVYTPALLSYHFQSLTFQKYHICEVYVLASWAYNAGSRKTCHVDVIIKADT